MKNDGDVFSAGGAIIEANATYVGGKEKNRHRAKRSKKTIGGVNKECVFALVQRDGGVRSFHIPSVNAADLFFYVLGPRNRIFPLQGEG